MLEMNTTEIKDMAKNTGYKNIAISFDVSGKKYLSCSCGYNGLVDSIEGKLYSKERIEESWGKILNNRLAERPIAKEKFLYGGICPECGTPVVYEDFDVSGDSCPIRYFPKVLQNDENFLVVNIRADGIIINSGNITLCDESLEQQVFLYMKNSRKFFVVTLEHSLSYRQEDGEEDIFYPGLTLEGGFLMWEGEKVGSILEKPEFFDFYADMNYYGSSAMNEASGLQEILDIFNAAAGTDIKLDEGYSLCETAAILFDTINMKYDRSMLPAWAKGNTSYYESVSKFYVGLLENGVDVNETDACLAFGAESIEEMNSYRSMVDFFNAKEEKARADRLPISDKERELVKRIPKNRLSAFLNIIDMYSADPGKVIRSIVYCRDMDISQAINLLSTIYYNNEEEAKKIVDFNVPVSNTLKTKYNLVNEGILTADQFDRLSKKPTLDNFHKVIG